MNISNNLTSNKNLKIKISTTNEEKVKARLKTDFIAEIYCPTKKKSLSKKVEFSK